MQTIIFSGTSHISQYFLPSGKHTYFRGNMTTLIYHFSSIKKKKKKTRNLVLGLILECARCIKRIRKLEILHTNIAINSQIRCVVEEGLNQLPYKECEVTTPTGHCYKGVEFEQGNCGVSIMRSGRSSSLSS